MTKLSEVEELLRKYPLYNSHGQEFPRNVLRRVPVPHIKLQPLQPSAEMFAPWYRECDELVKCCEVHDKAGELFDQWYSQRYMSNKPPGMVGNVILSPSRRD
ncbi:hypothetical protein HG536_0E05120 [Torulaspora globosa]|uniref:Multivesicular body sorting factor 12 domain-containing protein n=1 Tax=Torulaspora globosa TaxID=48254 RepID=A0A7G3ZJB5_9SACH|nr:uncharacterized protein HG536_0E05120 [Torulaspora globosa]QLL33601.1 hypothetical protein HG536_0E05120 [Torulaspora globosa]